MALDEFLAPDIQALQRKLDDSKVHVTSEPRTRPCMGGNCCRICCQKRGARVWPWRVDSPPLGPSNGLIQRLQNQFETRSISASVQVSGGANRNACGTLRNQTTTPAAFSSVEAGMNGLLHSVGVVQLYGDECTNRRTCRTAACHPRPPARHGFAPPLGRSQGPTYRRAPMAPAHAMGCPPNVVMCPRDGPWANSPNNDVDVARPPMAIPPPSACPCRECLEPHRCVKATAVPFAPCRIGSSKIRRTRLKAFGTKGCNHP